MIITSTSKKWYQSKTILGNILLFTGEVILLATGTFPMTPELVAGLLFINKVINIGLRFITTSSIK